MLAEGVPGRSRCTWHPLGPLWCLHLLLPHTPPPLGAATTAPPTALPTPHPTPISTFSFSPNSSSALRLPSPILPTSNTQPFHALCPPCSRTEGTHPPHPVYVCASHLRGHITAISIQQASISSLISLHPTSSSHVALIAIRQPLRLCVVSVSTSHENVSISRWDSCSLLHLGPWSGFRHAGGSPRYLLTM